MKRWIVETRDERSGRWNLVGTVVGPADAEAAAMAARREIDAVSTEAAVRVHDWWECPEGFQEAASQIDERTGRPFGGRSWLLQVAGRVVIPLLVGDTAGTLIGGAWLLLLGELRVVVLGIVAILAGPFVIGIATLPNSLLLVPLATRAERGQRKTVARVTSAAASLYLHALALGWAGSMVDLFLFQIFVGSDIPLATWTFGVVTWPVIFLMMQDQQQAGGNEFSLITTFFLNVGVLAALILVLWIGTGFLPALLAVAASLLLSWTIQMRIVLKAS